MGGARVDERERERENKTNIWSLFLADLVHKDQQHDSLSSRPRIVGVPALQLDVCVIFCVIYL